MVSLKNYEKKAPDLQKNLIENVVLKDLQY